MGWLCSPHEISLDGPLQTLARRRSLQRLQEQHPEVIQEVFRLCGINCWHIRSFAVDIRGTRRLIPVGGSRPWLDDRIGIPPGRDAKILGQNCRMSGYVSRWNKGGLHMFTRARSCNIAAICIKMFSGSGGTQKNVGAASICQGAQGLCTASGEGRMLNSDSVESLKGQERSMQDQASKKSIEIYKTHHDGFKTESLHSLVVFEFIYLDGWSFIFFDPGLFGTWTHPATNRVRLGWICATDFFQPQQLKAKRNLGKAVQDAAKRKGLKYDSTKPEGKLEKETYSREWARCTQGNWRT